MSRKTSSPAVAQEHAPYGRTRPPSFHRPGSSSLRASARRKPFPALPRHSIVLSRSITAKVTPEGHSGTKFCRKSAPGSGQRRSAWIVLNGVGPAPRETTRGCIRLKERPPGPGERLCARRTACPSIRLGPPKRTTRQLNPCSYSASTSSSMTSLQALARPRVASEDR